MGTKWEIHPFITLRIAMTAVLPAKTRQGNLKSHTRKGDNYIRKGGAQRANPERDIYPFLTSP
jgi:hypothetical protein